METIDIVHFDAVKHAEIFYKLNLSWLQEFGLNEEDLAILNNPEEHIIKQGGAILIAEIGDRPVGTVALKPMNSDLELTKMAVEESARGNGVASRLMESALQKAGEMNFNRIVLFTDPNKLQPAYLLYRKFGFTETMRYNTPDCRCTTAMIKALDKEFSKI